jgi:chromosome segregation ATPase
MKEKVAALKDSSEKINFSSLEQKIADLTKELSFSKEKLRNIEDSIQKVRLTNLDLQKKQENIKRRTESQQENLPESAKIMELRSKLQEKDQIIERLRLSAPEKLVRLENEIKEIRNLLQIGNEKPYFTTEEVVKKKQVERRSESRNREEVKDRFDDDELLMDWRRGDENSWNLSRDISPVEGRNFNYKRPQIPSRAWVKPKEDSGRFSAF